jgi:predicted dehydrogenase
MRVVQIGVSSFAKTWRAGLSEIPGLQVVGLVDVDREALDEARTHFGVPRERCFTNPHQGWYEELEADVVIDSTPHPSHYENAMRAFQAGLHVLTVKPMSDNYANAATMVRVAKQSQRKLVVAQQIRFFAPCLKLREYIAQGLVGEIAYAGVDAFFGRQGCVRVKWFQPYPLLLEAAIHHFDLMRWILGVDVVAVQADTWNMPWNEEIWGKKSACCVFRTESNARIVFRGLATDQAGEAYPGSWIVEGTEGILRLCGGEIWLGEAKLWPEEGAERSRLDLAALNAEVLRQTVEYVGGGAEPSVTGEDNLKSLAMVFGSIRSSESGRVQLLSELS